MSASVVLVTGTPIPPLTQTPLQAQKRLTLRLKTRRQPWHRLRNRQSPRRIPPPLPRLPRLPRHHQRQSRRRKTPPSQRKLHLRPPSRRLFIRIHRQCRRHCKSRSRPLRYPRQQCRHRRRKPRFANPAPKHARDQHHCALCRDPGVQAPLDSSTRGRG